MHRGIHVHILSSTINATPLWDQVVRKYNTRHRTSATHNIFLLRFRDPSSLWDEVLWNSIHVKVEVLIGVHMWGGDVGMRMFATPYCTCRIHAVQLFLLHTLESVAQFLCNRKINDLLWVSLRGNLRAFRLNQHRLVTSIVVHLLLLLRIY